MNKLLLEKIEELTLYILEQERKLSTQAIKNTELENRLNQLEIALNIKK